MSELTQSPTDYKLQLGDTLNALRLRAGLHRADAAATLGCSEAKIGSIERGRSAVNAFELRELLNRYEVAGDERSAVEELGAEARKRRARTPWGAAIPDRLKRFFRIEETSTAIRYYHPEFIHGLGQTEDYARALIGANTALRPVEVDRLVQARMARQARLVGPHAPTLSMVLSEAALLQNVGGAEVMRGQIRHLIGLAERPDVSFRIIRFGVGAHPNRGFPFTILTPAAKRTIVVYLENLTDGIFVEEPDRVAQYEAAFVDLVKAAVSVEDTVKLLATVAMEL